MRLLAIETTTVACSVALQCDGEIAERHELQPREHSRLLLPMITGLLETAGIVASVLDGIVLGNGPGSFIGMRLGTAVAQGLAFSSGLRIQPVSSLEAIAAEVFDSASEHPEIVAVAQDAHMNEVYLGLYRWTVSDGPALARPECLQAVGEISFPPGKVFAAGRGWQRYPELLDINREPIISLAAVDYPRAKFLLASGERAFARGPGLNPEDVEPAYLRHKVAEPRTSRGPVPGH